MLTTSCPECEKEVTLPVGARADSRVRCPLCSAEYSLENVFADLPPLLELLDAPSTNGATSGATFDFDQGESEAGEESSEEGGIGLAAPAETVPQSSGFDFGEGEESAAPSSGGTATTTRKARPRKKSASPVKAIIGVIVGGLFAIPIAQLTLWYLPGGWDIEQRDPMEIGRKLSGTFASFLVPSWVANPDAGDGGTAAVDPATEDPQKPTDEDDEPPADYEEPGGLGSLLGQNGNKPDAGTNGGNGNDGGNGNGSDGGTNGNGNSGSGEDDEPDPPQPESRVKDAPIYTSSDLAEELKVVKEEVKRFDDVYNEALDFAERKSIRDDFFAAAAKLAEVTTFVDKKPAGHREHLDQILQEAASTASKRRIIGVSAHSIIKADDREADGIILAGEVTEINKRGPLYETVMAIDANNNPPVSIYGAGDPSQAFKVGEKVMILGVIIDKPADNIRDFKGPREEPVIWGGYSQVVPPLDEE